MALQSKTVIFNVASTLWIVNHNLGKYVTSDVFIFDEFDRPVKALPLEVLYISDNQMNIVFSTEQRGIVKVM